MHVDVFGCVIGGAGVDVGGVVDRCAYVDSGVVLLVVAVLVCRAPPRGLCRFFCLRLRRRQFWQRRGLWSCFRCGFHSAIGPAVKVVVENAAVPACVSQGDRAFDTWLGNGRI